MLVAWVGLTWVVFDAVGLGMVAVAVGGSGVRVGTGVEDGRPATCETTAAAIVSSIFDAELAFPFCEQEDNETAKSIVKTKILVFICAIVLQK